MLTLDRIVSLEDYEDFARAFAGIGKALATWTWIGERARRVLTVAGANGAAVDRGHASSTRNLRRAPSPRSAIRHVPLVVKPYRPRFFRAAARLRSIPRYLPDEVAGRGRARRCATRFSFDARDFGQPVHVSEVIARDPGGAGVVAVDVDGLLPLGRRQPGPSPAAANRRAAGAQRPSAAQAPSPPAELLRSTATASAWR